MPEIQERGRNTMKAIEYFKKYKNTINTPEGAADLMIEMSKEVQTIADMRHTQSDEAAKAIVKELNQKWNAIARLVEKNLGHRYMKTDGFMTFWKSQIKGL